MIETIQNLPVWAQILIGVGVVLLVGVLTAAIKGHFRGAFQKLWAVIYPLLIPLALVGAVEMWNKIQIGVVGRPWLVKPRVEQPEQYQDYNY